MDFLQGTEAPAVEVMMAPSKKQLVKAEQRQHLEALEQEVLEESLQVLNGALKFNEVEHDDEDPPDEWVERYGATKATKMLKLAKAGKLPANMAPVGIKVAQQVATGILKARGDGNAPRQLNVQFVQFQAPVVNYPVREVER